MRDSSCRPSRKCTHRHLSRWKRDRKPARKSWAGYSTSRFSCTWRHCAATPPGHRAEKYSRVGLQAGSGEREKDVFEMGGPDDDWAAVSFVVAANLLD